MQPSTSANATHGTHAARATNDAEERRDLYRGVHETLSEQLPFLPLTNTTHGFIASTSYTGLDVYEDGVLRVDRLARRG